MRTLTYQVPLVGTLEAPLYAEASELLDRLDATGETSRLRDLDHLGLVRLAIEGAHHPRWEYVVTTLALIARAKQAAGIPLSGPADVVGVTFSSGAALLSCWALLLNTGHLRWTFSAERVLLQELWRDARSRRDFELSAPSGTEGEFRRVLSNGDAYRLYPLLALLRLPRTVDGPLEPWRAALTGYLNPPSPNVDRLRALYRRLRRIAYLTLDTTYAPSHVRLSLSQLLSDPMAFKRSALSSTDVDEAELAGLDSFMSRQVYLAEPVLKVAAEVEDSLRSLTREALEHRGLDDTVQSLADGTIQDRVVRTRLTGSVRTTFRLDPPVDIFVSERINPRLHEARIRVSAEHRHVHTIPIMWQVPGRQEWVIQIGTSADVVTPTAAPIATLLEWAETRRVDLTKQLAGSRRPDIREHEFVQSSALGTMASDLLVATLLTAFSRDVRWEWTSSGSFGRAAVGSREVVRALLGLEMRRSHSRRDRRAELALTQRCAPSTTRYPILASTGNLTAFDPITNQPVAELDGIVVAVKDHGLELTLVEAKVGGMSFGAARRQLIETISELRPTSGLASPKIRSLRQTAREARGSRARAALLLSFTE